MKVGGDSTRARIVAQALFLEHRLIQPVGELDQILFTGFGWNGVVVSYAEKYGGVGEGNNLIVNEVVPGHGQILADGERLGDVLRLMLHVFIEIVDGAKIAEMPVERGAGLFYTGGDAGHDYVAAIARIAGDGEAPGGVGRGGLCEGGAGISAERC